MLAFDHYKMLADLFLSFQIEIYHISILIMFKQLVEVIKHPCVKCFLKLCFYWLCKLTIHFLLNKVIFHRI